MFWDWQCSWTVEDPEYSISHQYAYLSLKITTPKLLNFAQILKLSPSCQVNRKEKSLKVKGYLLSAPPPGVCAIAARGGEIVAADD